MEHGEDEESERRSQDDFVVVDGRSLAEKDFRFMPLRPGERDRERWVLSVTLEALSLTERAIAGGRSVERLDCSVIG